MLTNTNKLLKNIEATQQFKDIEKLIAKSLEHQWQDLILSGLINTFFIRYKDFFVNRRGVKIKIRKAVNDEPNNDIQSIDELRQEENRTQQRDRLLLPEKILDMGALILFLQKAVDNNMNSVASYYKFKPELRNYLTGIANKSGQNVLDQIAEEITMSTPISGEGLSATTVEGIKALKFRLSKKEYRDKINQRIEDLIKGMDETTKKRMVYELSQGIRKGETKQELVDRLQNRGIELSESRAARIARTETQAMAGFMRQETARLNGVQTKVWHVMSEAPCALCQSLDGQETSIYKDFQVAGFSSPNEPAHPNCYCEVEYKVEDASCGFFIKSKKETLDDRINKLVQKAANDFQYYSDGKDSDISTCVNPNALWAGGESLVGSDKEIGNYYDEIKNLPGELFDNHLAAARDNLSDEGFVQLRLSLGLKGKINAS